MAELLISLAILGVIATFTIPKVLQSQQDAKWKAIAKEAAGTVSAAYDAYRLQNLDVNGMDITDLTPYLNYVTEDTTNLMDSFHADGVVSFDCSLASIRCYRLHNGSVLYTNNWSGYFAGTTTTDAIVFLLDPDGKVTDGTTNGPGKAVTFWLYNSGRLATYGGILNPTRAGTNAAYVPDSSYDPPWFNWN